MDRGSASIPPVVQVGHVLVVGAGPCGDGLVEGAEHLVKVDGPLKRVEVVALGVPAPAALAALELAEEGLVLL